MWIWSTTENWTFLLSILILSCCWYFSKCPHTSSRIVRPFIIPFPSSLRSSCGQWKLFPSLVFSFYPLSFYSILWAYFLKVLKRNQKASKWYTTSSEAFVMASSGNPFSWLFPRNLRVKINWFLKVAESGYRLDQKKENSSGSSG